MCNNKDFLNNLPSSGFSGHFFIIDLYFMTLSSDVIDVPPMVEPRSFAVSAYFRLKPSFLKQLNSKILTLYQAEFSFLRKNITSIRITTIRMNPRIHPIYMMSAILLKMAILVNYAFLIKVC